VLREVGDPVDAEVGIAQEDRAGLRDGERCSTTAKSTSASSCGAATPAISRLPAISAR